MTTSINPGVKVYLSSIESWRQCFAIKLLSAFWRTRVVDSMLSCQYNITISINFGKSSRALFYFNFLPFLSIQFKDRNEGLDGQEIVNAFWHICMIRACWLAELWINHRQYILRKRIKTKGDVKKSSLSGDSRTIRSKDILSQKWTVFAASHTPEDVIKWKQSIRTSRRVR